VKETCHIRRQNNGLLPPNYSGREAVAWKKVMQMFGA